MTTDSTVSRGISNIKGVIFDVGGTVVYSNDDYLEEANAWSATLALRSWGYEIESKTFVRDLVALRRDAPKEEQDFQEINTAKDLLAEVTRSYGIELDEERLERLERAFYIPEVQASVPLPGMVEVIHALDNQVKLSVISNTRSHYVIEGTLVKLGVRESFDPFLTSAGFGIRKPSPKPFKAILAAWQLAPQEVMMIGDSLYNDIASAKRLGLRTIWQKLDAKADDEVKADAVAEKPKDILDILSSRNV